MNTWVRSVKVGTTTAMLKVLTTQEFSVRTAVTSTSRSKITGRFATVTQQKLNVEKTKVWGTTETALQSVRNLDLKWRAT